MLAGPRIEVLGVTLRSPHKPQVSTNTLEGTAANPGFVKPVIRLEGFQPCPDTYQVSQALCGSVVRASFCCDFVWAYHHPWQWQCGLATISFSVSPFRAPPSPLNTNVFFRSLPHPRNLDTVIAVSPLLARTNRNPSLRITATFMSPPTVGNCELTACALIMISMKKSTQSMAFCSEKSAMFASRPWRFQLLKSLSSSHHESGGGTSNVIPALATASLTR